SAHDATSAPNAMRRVERSSAVECTVAVQLEGERPQRDGTGTVRTSPERASQAEHRTTDRDSSPPTLPRGFSVVARTRVVSWLRAASLAFPTVRPVAT